MPQKLMDAELMKKIERLSIAPKKLFPGTMKGKRRSTKRGSSVEFADYRDYQLGDDFRFIDWNIYARLDKLFLKTFVEEENIHIHILLDVSVSMTFGTPSKLEYGKRIAAALGYIGLVDIDMVTMTTFSDNLTGQLRPVTGKDQIFTLLSFLESAQPSQKTLMDACFKRYAFTAMRPGVAIVISDFLVPRVNYEEGLKALIYRNFDVNVIHVMSEEELHPTLSGELKLQDAETGDTKEITITDRMLERYQRRLATFCRNLDQFCTRNNITYLLTSTSLPFEDLILRSLRRERVLL
jgi:uncharacterized protein (DUF58 family)